MQFYGIQKTTLVDYPGHVAATIFTGGCNMRCPFCHNPELVENISQSDTIPWEELYEFFKKRQALLDGVCITGGEPLMHKAIKGVIDDLHGLGLKVKIDTNGTFPSFLRELPADFIAMDIKTSLENYYKVGYRGSEEIESAIVSSIEYIIASGIDHEFRTTLAPGIVTKEDIQKILPFIKGAKKYSLAQFRPDKTLNREYEKVQPYTVDYIKEIEALLKESGIPYETRVYSV